MSLRRKFFLFLFLAAACAFAVSPCEAARFTVSGTLEYEDGDAANLLTRLSPLDNSFFRKARLVLITVQSESGQIYGRSLTDREGKFNVGVNSPGNKAMRVVAEVDNFLLTVVKDSDGTDQPYKLELASIPAAQTTDVVLPTSSVFMHYEDNVIEDPMPFRAWLSFSAALNINEVIVSTYSEVEDQRDRRVERDNIGQTTVEYCNRSGPHYFLDLVLSCAVINGSFHPPTATDGLDEGYLDSTIAHEYTHHLQYEIGSWDAHWERHENCEEIDTVIHSDSEFAWSEGSADYVAEHMLEVGDRMSKRNPTIDGHVEDGCQPMPRFVSARDEERFIAVEGNVIAVLWDLDDGLGSGEDAWDRIDGKADNGRGFRSIVQIFDHELDNWDHPDLIEFYDVWRARFPTEVAFGNGAIDPILNRYSIVPGGETVNDPMRMEPKPLIEAKPVLPEGYTSTFSPGALTPLTVRRELSFVNGAGLADTFTLRLGASNLGTLSIVSDDFPGFATDNVSAGSVSVAGIRFHQGAPAWLSVSNTGGFAPAALRQVTFNFLPAAMNLIPNHEVWADVDFAFHFHRADSTFRTVTETVRVIFKMLDGPNNDADGDGLTSQDEIDLRSTPGFECLDPKKWDSDGDLLTDAVEIRLGTSPCRRDTDGDGADTDDFKETREICFKPLVFDDGAKDWGDPDADGLTNEQEQAKGSHVCRADSDNDNINDKDDNCPNLASSAPLPDFDEDGMGDPCDPDADDDFCEKPFDANDTEKSSFCAMANRNRWNPRRYQVEEDLRLQFLDAYLDEIGPPRPRQCGSVTCPPPYIVWTDRNFGQVDDARPGDFGFEAGDGFAWTSARLGDLDLDGTRDLAVGAPWADGPLGQDVGAVVLLSGRNGGELGRLYGTVSGAGFGSVLEALGDGRLAVGAPGAVGKSGSVFLVRPKDRVVERSFSAGAAGDRFGNALADVGDRDGDGKSDVAIGAPGALGTGAVYSAGSKGVLTRIAVGKQSGDRFGERLAAAGDTTGDGKTELLAGAPGADRSSRVDTGEVSLHGLDGTRLWSREGREKNELFGSALAVVKSGSELLVGAPGASCAAGALCGRGYLLRADGSVPGFVSGTVAGAELGRFVAAGPDLNGDGLKSLVLIEVGPASGEGLGRSHFFER